MADLVCDKCGYAASIVELLFPFGVLGRWACPRCALARLFFGRDAKPLERWRRWKDGEE